MLVLLVSLSVDSSVIAEGEEERPTRTTDAWLADIDALDRLLRQHHPDPFFRSGEGAWRDGLAEARELANSGAPDARITAKLMSAVAHLGDGHTRLEPVGIDPFAQWIPLRFYEFEEGIYVTAAAEQFAGLIGKRVTGLGGHAVSEVLAGVASATSADNVFQAMEGAAALLSNAGLLTALDIVGDPAEPVPLAFEDEQGHRLSRTIPTVHSWYSVNYRNWGELFGPPFEPFDVYRTPFHGGKKPLAYRESPNATDAPFHASRRPFWARLDSKGRILTFQFNYFADIGDVGWKEFRSQLWQMLDSAHPGRFVMDLRYNFGGDGDMVRDLINELLARPDYANGNRLVVLTGRQTFSAAIMLIAELEKHTDAVFIGEPPGAPLNHFGDPVSLKLPSGRLELEVSTLYWQLGHPRNRATVLPVSQCVPVRASDYFAGKDLAWNTAFSVELPEIRSRAARCS